MRIEAGYAKTSAEKQKSLDEAARVLRTIIAAEHRGKVDLSDNRYGARSANSKTRSPKTGNCTLQTNNTPAGHLHARFGAARERMNASVSRAHRSASLAAT